MRFPRNFYGKCPNCALDGFAVELFLNGDVRYGRGWRSAVPIRGDRLGQVTVMIDYRGPALVQLRSQREEDRRHNARSY